MALEGVGLGGMVRVQGAHEVEQPNEHVHVKKDAVFPFAPEQLVPAGRVEGEKVGANITRKPIYGETKYFTLDGLYDGDKLVGFDWHKAAKKGEKPSSLDAKTAIVAALTSVGGEISSVFGQGSPRIANLLRGRPYVQISPPGGRVDHIVEGADKKPLGPLETGVKIGGSEVEEETGGRIVPGFLDALHEGWVPTNAHLSSEADRPVGAIVDLPPGAKSIGDGGNMEIVGSAAATYSLVKDAFRLARSGRINEAARWEVYMREMLTRIGYSIELGGFLGANKNSPERRAFSNIDHPGDQTPRKSVEYRPIVKEVLDAHAVDAKHTVFELIVDHGKKESDGTLTEIGRPHPNIFIHTNYDLAKYVEMYVDEVAGPMVKLRHVERPAQSGIEGGRAPVLRDTMELEVPLPFHGNDVEELIRQAEKIDFSALARKQIEAHVPGNVMQLGAPDVASAGQSDLQYHFFAVEIAKPASAEGFVPLAQAIEQCRNSEAATRALLYRLADQLGWMCSANTSVANQAKRHGIAAADLPRLI